MMKFKDLELPKELAKKKKLDLYKCWIVEPLEKGSDERILDLDVSFDRYGLTENAAIAWAIEKFHKDNPDIDPFKRLEILANKFLVVTKITLFADTMDEDILVPPENPGMWEHKVDYDKETMQLNASIYHRISDSSITNYKLNSLECTYTTSGHIVIDEISLEEQVVNTALTGERK